MKAINIYFEDVDYERLLKLKGKLHWREFILQLVKDKEVENK